MELLFIKIKCYDLIKCIRCKQQIRILILYFLNNLETNIENKKE